MSLKGRGILANFMNVAADKEPDFNEWYDREHMEERVEMDGFVEARRYIALDAPQKYLALYTTRNVGVLSSPAYLSKLQNQSEWSLRTIANFQQGSRAVAHIPVSQGIGRGGVIAFVRLQRDDGGALQERCADAIAGLCKVSGIVGGHFLKTAPEGEAPAGTTSDCFVVIEASNADVARKATDRIGSLPGVKVVTSGIYSLLWGLSQDEL